MGYTGIPLCVLFQGRRSDTAKVPVADIAIPMKLKGTNLKPGKS